MGETERRRRRLRPPSAAAGPVPGPPPGGPPAVPPPDDAVTAAIEDPVEEAPRPARPGGPARPARGWPASGAPVREPGSGGARVQPGGAAGDDAERGLRGLVGSGSSQVSVGAALRARDAARPTDEQLAEAEANLPIVRRNWMPREDLPRTR
jgi:hypothetical protein